MAGKPSVVLRHLDTMSKVTNRGESTMNEASHQYSGEATEGSYDVQQWILAGECVRGLLAVFAPDESPWIAADADSTVRDTDTVPCRCGGSQTNRSVTEHTQRPGFRPKHGPISDITLQPMIHERSAVSLRDRSVNDRAGTL